MTTKRKPEDVVLDEEAVGNAEKVFRSFPGNVRGSLSASFRAYIAELDLIPRPQTVEEWAEQMPESVWRENWQGEKVGSVVVTAYVPKDIHGKEYFIYPNLAKIPRPKRPRMTDKEIDKAAIIYASNCIEGHFAQDGGGAYLEGLTLDDLVEAGSVYHKAYLAERAKLEKERGDE